MQNIEYLEPSFTVLVNSYDYEAAARCQGVSFDINGEIAQEAKETELCFVVRFRIWDDADRDTIVASYAIDAKAVFDSPPDRLSKPFAELLLYMFRMAIFHIQGLHGEHTHPTQYMAGIIDNSPINTVYLYRQLYNKMPRLYPLQFDENGKPID